MNLKLCVKGSRPCLSWLVLIEESGYMICGVVQQAVAGEDVKRDVILWVIHRLRSLPIPAVT